MKKEDGKRKKGRTSNGLHGRRRSGNGSGEATRVIAGHSEPAQLRGDEPNLQRSSGPRTRKGRSVELGLEEMERASVSRQHSRRSHGCHYRPPMEVKSVLFKKAKEGRAGEVNLDNVKNVIFSEARSRLRSCCFVELGRGGRRRVELFVLRSGQKLENQKTFGLNIK